MSTPTDDPDWIDAKTARTRLRVKAQTLYAYVSRGWIRSRGVVGSRRREYLATDVARVAARSGARAGHTAVAAGALRFGEPVLDSSITEIAGGSFSYRGHDAPSLANDDVGFEAAAELLWSATMPTDRVRWPQTRVPPRRLPALGRGARPFDRMLAALPALAVADETRDAPDPRVQHDVARRIVLGLVDAIADRTSEAPKRVDTVAARLLVALGHAPSSRARAQVDRALTLLADHELNPSTFAARVAASTGADLYACVTAALATLSGPHHGAMSRRVDAMLREIGRPERVASVLRDRLAHGDAVPGFGHRLYPDGDPRASPLLHAARELAPRRAAIALAVVDVMAIVGGEAPNVDFGLVTLTRALDLPAESAMVIFAVGRCAGWVAHALEQRQQGHVLRPRARYVPP